MGAGLAEGHSNASGIYDACLANLAVELHMSVTAHDYSGVEILEERQEAIVGSQASKDVVLVLRRGMAKQDGSEAADFQSYCFWPHG